MKEGILPNKMFLDYSSSIYPISSACLTQLNIMLMMVTMKGMRMTMTLRARSACPTQLKVDRGGKTTRTTLRPMGPQDYGCDGDEDDDDDMDGDILDDDMDGDILDDVDDDDDIAQNEFLAKCPDRGAVIPEDKQQVELELCS